MSGDREEKYAAIFDFDGVLYSQSARWKIIDARLGVVGSRVSWEQGLRMYNAATQKFEELQVTECFAPDEFEFATVRDRANLTLPRHLMKTAQNHAFRGHDIFVLSRYAFRDFLRVNERFMGNPGPLPGHLPSKENPFEHSKLLVTEHYSTAHGDVALSLSEKFRTITKMLSREGAAEPAQGDENDQASEDYARIFLYYTEDGYLKLVEDFVREEMQNLTGGRNAIVPSLIASIPEAP